MFCPKCGSNQSDELKFCKSCGTNLFAVRQVADTGQTGEKFDWSKTWLAEMLLSGEESVKRAAKIERLQGITPETKRRNEIKAGVITGSIGVGLMILLYVLMTGIILSGNVSAGVAEILSRVWVAGVIPIFVGLALIVNGVFVSKKTEKLHGHETDAGTGELNKPAENGYLPPAETNQLFSPGFSVTDETTEHLKEPVQRKAKTPNAD
jgi:Predicted membrane protein